MARKMMSWKTKGMNRDLSVSAFNPEFSFENMNLRLSTNESNTLLSWVTEKGTKKVSLNIIPSPTQGRHDGDWPYLEKVENPDTHVVTYNKITGTKLLGTPIGTAVINNYLVVFTHNEDDSIDRIYKLWYPDTLRNSMQGSMLYQGELGFDIKYPIETSVSYESESIQKVYWTDHLNQPRLINIVAEGIDTRAANYFDFVPCLQLNEEVKVKKMLGASGMFAPGVIQYAFTYYNKNGQESCIFYTTPLLYTSYADRGGSPDDKVENAFKIIIKNPDINFDYLRIYSIQRTSVDGTPLCKRVQDIKITSSNQTISYIDTGLSGDSIDPMELLYKGGEEVVVGTLEQKDNTLFFGNLELKTNVLEKKLTKEYLGNPSFVGWARNIYPTWTSQSPYPYRNQLNTYDVEGNSCPCSTFKSGECYRLGVQFQYKTGKWSKPVHLGDYTISNRAEEILDEHQNNAISLPTVKCTLSYVVATKLREDGFLKVRPVVVFPKLQDRNILCQGVVNPTLYTEKHHKDNDLYAQASWFFRPPSGNSHVSADEDSAVSPISSGSLFYTKRETVESNSNDNYNPSDIRCVEIQGDFEKVDSNDESSKFEIDHEFVTFNSPDVEFDDQLWLIDYSSSFGVNWIGNVEFKKTLSDIDIQTESPTISSLGSGFIHKSFVKDYSHGIVSGLFYDDVLVDDEHDDGKDGFMAYPKMYNPVKWMVYLWNKTGSLNNDINRPSDKGVRTAMLKKKRISNLRFADTNWLDATNVSSIGCDNIQLFSSDEPTIIKLGDKIYSGNIDTAVLPTRDDGMYFAFNESDIKTTNKVSTPFNSGQWWKLFNLGSNGDAHNNGYYKWDSQNSAWGFLNNLDLGDTYLDLVISKSPVRITYKSTPHLVLDLQSNLSSSNAYQLPIVEITKNVSNTTRFGGTTEALKENVWIPCGEPVKLKDVGNTTFEYKYGDTYYQRWDCLKTYAFTREDVNQVIEIGSFMLESRVNIDGRYDRNRGQINNTNAHPTNFNLLNPVYSQTDNFFTYRIMDDDVYENKKYPNMITWSKTKESGADVDLWTNVTLGSTLELDGNKGEINKLIRFNNQLFAFQDTGISHILYNSNVQISSTNGVPIEIANSGKVDGKDYKSDTIGCSNKWAMVNTPNGIYFMDNNDKSIYLFNGQLLNVSSANGFNSWCKQHIPASSIKWDPFRFGDNFGPDLTGISNFIAQYDKKNQDVLWINETTALAYSEKVGAFTSFYSYEGTPYLCNIGDMGIWIKPDSEGNAVLWEHQEGEYGQFFGKSMPYWMTLVGNAEPNLDKIFTNLEFRASVEGEGCVPGYHHFDDSFDFTFFRNAMGYSHYTPFDGLEVWNEYQHGITALEIKNSRGSVLHHQLDEDGIGTSHLNRKFRIWRCDIPRDNAPTGSNYYQNNSYYSSDAELGIGRKFRKPVDRMRNMWLYLKLIKFPKQDDIPMPKTEVHDIQMVYHR